MAHIYHSRRYHRDNYEQKLWPRQYLTLAVLLTAIGTWTLVLWVSGAFG